MRKSPLTDAEKTVLRYLDARTDELKSQNSEAAREQFAALVSEMHDITDYEPSEWESPPPTRFDKW